MTSRERLLAVLKGEIPDCVPVCPDISNMVPARLTGKPFWDIYVYQNPPLWKAYIDAVKFLGMDGGFELFISGNGFRNSRIVHRYPDGRFVTQHRDEDTGRWSPTVEVHTADNPPATNVLPEKLGLPATPAAWEDIEGVRQWPAGAELMRLIRRELGQHGVLGAWLGGATTCVLRSPEDVFAYYDNPVPFHDMRDQRLEQVEQSMAALAQQDEKPDFLFCGGSGSLIYQTPDIFRDLALPILKRATELAYDAGIPTHVHSCGPERELVRIAAEETMLTVIDPLETPPMGDCRLKELKRLYGERLVLKGNLHTTRVMLHGTHEDVTAASRKAIDEAAGGGRFILSTGDQCGRDTPLENLRAMIETARTYGKYR